MLGTQQEWPNSGEIDIIESINNQDHNQIALHTTGGCFQAQIPGTQTGVTLERDCSTPRGCLVAETKPNSFGAGFAQAGGGAFALQFAESGIYAWFWSVRLLPCLPSSLLTASQFEEARYTGQRQNRNTIQFY